MKTFQRVFQPNFEDVYGKDHPLKGQWQEKVFGNDYPITLELGCGKGEYTISLARKYPERNFIGVDIKGARIWKGAKTANENDLRNVAFLRTRIELINSFFSEKEVNEVWITFPDPQLKKRRNKKRLTAPRFLNQYRAFLADNGTVHLKTDNGVLYRYTLALVEHNQLEILSSTDDLYNSDLVDDVRSIKTFYESRFLEEGARIHYLAFRLPSDKTISEPPDEEAYEREELSSEST
jgi:tRNA (guanine-N7-)-methyltransferase